MEHSAADLLGPAAINAVFSAPQIDGRFDGALGALAQDLGQRRPLVVLAFAPRSAGTFLRSAAIEALDGQLVRFTHAEGGRDGALYLPYLIAYFKGAMTADIAVTHQHMPAAIANRHLIDAFALRPAVMVRSIPDMMASLMAMLEDDVPLGFSFHKPAGFAHMPPALKADVMVDLMGPWYAQFFAGWKAYAAERPGRVLLLDYDDFCREPAETLEAILAHARAPRPYATCQAAIDAVWQQRALFRCNRGGGEREKTHFSAAQLLRLERFVSYYDTLEEWRDRLLTATES